MQQTPLQVSCSGLPSPLWLPALPLRPLLLPQGQFPRRACQGRAKPSLEQGPLELLGYRETRRACRGGVQTAGVMGALGQLEVAAIANLYRKIYHLNDWYGHTGECQPISAPPHCVTNSE